MKRITTRIVVYVDTRELELNKIGMTLHFTPSCGIKPVASGCDREEIFIQGLECMAHLMVHIQP